MIDQAIQRAQAYFFFSHALIYPQDNWIRELPLLEISLRNLGVPYGEKEEVLFPQLDLESLQAEHRDIFGLTGSLLYETELGLPHEFRQSQELADIAGFYRAFGFTAGGAIRERPDYLAMELEFMGLLTLKEAYAAESGNAERVEVCRRASISFLTDHLGRWIEVFAGGLSRAAGITKEADLSGRPYLWLARLAADFVHSDAEALGANLEQIPLRAAMPTPLGPELSCGDCLAAN